MYNNEECDNILQLLLWKRESEAPIEVNHVGKFALT